MNPIKALLDSFDRLINERGSAAILREHLSLLQSQFTIFEKENQILKTEKEDLRIKIEDCQKIKQELLDTISELQKKLSHKSSRRVISPGIVWTPNDPDLDKIK